MSKQKKRKNKQQSEIVQQNVIMPETFDYQKFADAIVEAQIKAKEKEDGLNKQKSEEANIEWQKIIGYKEYSDDKKWLIKRLHKLKNVVVVFFYMLFFKKKNAKYDVATFAILKLFLSVLFGIFKFLLYLFSIGLLISTFYSFTEKAFVFSGIPLCYAFLSFMIARLIRVAQFEVENMNEREYLIGILSAVTSFMAMIFALLALFIEK